MRTLVLAPNPARNDLRLGVSSCTLSGPHFRPFCPTRRPPLSTHRAPFSTSKPFPSHHLRAFLPSRTSCHETCQFRPLVHPPVHPFEPSHKPFEIITMDTFNLRSVTRWDDRARQSNPTPLSFSPTRHGTWPAPGASEGKGKKRDRWGMQSEAEIRQ